MVSIAQTRIKLDKNALNWLKNKGVSVPEDAKTVEHILVPKFKEYTEMFTFLDKQDMRLTQQKNHVNKVTKEKEIQLREYDYIKRQYGKGKLEEVVQTTISPNGEEKSEVWRFYHPKDDSPVRFSHKGEGIDKNNYLKARGSYIDKNGLRIRPISTAEYYDRCKDLDDKHFIDAPWTLDESITTKGICGTDSVQECTVVGIYGDKGLSLNHINPNNPANKKFEEVEYELLDQLEQQGKNARAFVIGACDEDYNSRKQYENIIDLLTTRRVFHSRFKTGDRVLYGPFKNNSRVKGDDSKKLKYGTATPFEWQSGQHMICCENGEIKLANSIIDSELKRGNTDPKSLIGKSFSEIG